jgi:hypothetical protein
MDDPTSRCENGTDNETHSPRPPIPSGGLIFFLKLNSGQLACSDAPILERMPGAAKARDPQAQPQVSHSANGLYAPPRWSPA